MTAWHESQLLQTDLHQCLQFNSCVIGVCVCSFLTDTINEANNVFENLRQIGPRIEVICCQQAVGTLITIC